MMQGNRRLTACALAVVLAGTLGVVRTGRAADPPVKDPQQAILGNWLVASRDGIIQITRAGDGTYQGRIVGGTNPKGLDSHNPNRALRHNTLKGTVIMRHLRYRGDDSWTGGSIYDPDSGQTYGCSVRLLDQNHLRMRGYLGFSFLGRSQVWTRYTGTRMDLPGPLPR